jgi:hypothetical protein
MRDVLFRRSKLTALIVASALLPTAHAASITYQGPLTVDAAYIAAHGAVITGNYQGTLTQPAIYVNTSTPVTIKKCNLTGPADLIYGLGANITVTNCTGISTNPNVNGQQKGMFLHVEGAYNVDMQRNTITGSSFGVYINSYKGNHTPSQTIVITHNVMNNIDARPSNGNGGYATSGQWNAHAIQLNQVQGVPYMRMGWNQVVNVPFDSQCSDIINIFKSSGTKASPLVIHDNYLQGALPANPGVDKYTGGGIITDGGATDTVATATSFVNVYNNQIVASANYGISIAAGHDIKMYDNRIVSSGYTASGAFYPETFANGINNYNNYGQPSSVMFNDMTSTNVSGLIKKSSTNGPIRSDWYLPNQSGNTNTSYQPSNSSTPSIADEAAEFTAWQAKLKAQNQTIGSVAGTAAAPTDCSCKTSPTAG